MVRKSWSAEGIVNYILYLHAKGEPLYSAYVQREYGDLHRAAFRYFGNWENAIESAGLDYEKIRKRKRWAREEILKKIYELYKKGEDLSWRKISLGSYSALGYAAIKKFGSWGKALKVSGIDYSKIRRYKFWDKEEIKKEILRCYSSGVSLNAKNIQKTYPKLYDAATNRFSSWRRAIEYAGLNYYEIAVRIKREPEEILQEIKKIKERGESLSDTYMRKYYPALHASACRAFGRWTYARKVAGDSTNYRKISAYSL